MKRIKFSYIMTTLLVLILISFLLNDTTTVKGSTQQPTKLFKSIQIEKHDTLWKIAEENIDEYYLDIYAYIDEVKAINKLTSDKINAGDYLIIPYLASNESH